MTIQDHLAAAHNAAVIQGDNIMAQNIKSIINKSGIRNKLSATSSDGKTGNKLKVYKRGESGKSQGEDLNSTTPVSLPVVPSIEEVVIVGNLEDLHIDLKDGVVEGIVKNIEGDPNTDQVVDLTNLNEEIRNEPLPLTGTDDEEEIEEEDITEEITEDLDKVMELEMLHQSLKGLHNLTDEQRVERFGSIKGIKKQIVDVFGTDVDKGFTASDIHNLFNTLVGSKITETEAEIVAHGGQIID